MTLYLALDTATDCGSVAIGQPGQVAAELVVANRRHSAALMPGVEEVLRLAGATYADLSGIVVADGPGSFTGLRIGFATVKGILREHERLSLVTAPSLLSTAWGAAAFHAGPIAALYDALRGELFGAVYTFEASRVIRKLAPTLGTVSRLAEQSSATPTLAVGDGAVLHADAVREWTGRDPVGPLAGAVPRAGALLGLLAVEGATTAVDDPVLFEPAYGRLAEAQVRWERAHGRELGERDRRSADQTRGRAKSS